MSYSLIHGRTRQVDCDFSSDDSDLEAYRIKNKQSRSFALTVSEIVVVRPHRQNAAVHLGACTNANVPVGDIKQLSC
jgi:hypothetical protein